MQRRLSWVLVLSCATAGCSQCTPGASPTPQASTDARAAAPAPPVAPAPKPPSAAWTKKELQGIRDLSPDTFDEGDFAFHFRTLVCDFGKASCSIEFRMVTNFPTRPGLQPATFLVTTYADEKLKAPVEARILSVTGPGTCKPVRELIGGSGCTAIDASCVVNGIASEIQFDDRHWTGLCACIKRLETDAHPPGMPLE